MKIAYCLNSIQEIGGISSVTVSKANALAEKGHEVFVIVTDHEPEKGSKLSKQVHLIDLVIKYYKDDWKSKIHVIKAIIIKRRIHKKKLTIILNEIRPDIVISVGQSEKYLLSEIKGDWKKIREFHYDKFYRLRTANNVVQKMGAHLINIYDYNLKIKKYDHIVVLTKEDQKNWDIDNISVIPNPINLIHKSKAALNEKKILAVGRLVEQKNFKSLINTFKKVVEKHPDWILDIYGEGNLKGNLQSQIKFENLSNHIFLKGFSENHNEIYGKSSIFIMTSIYEGFPLVLLEAMSFGLPLISYDCPCGPKDIINNGINGFLIPYGDEKAFAETISLLIENKSLRDTMGKNAKKKSEEFNIDKIINKWEILFTFLINS